MALDAAEALLCPQGMSFVSRTKRAVLSCGDYYIYLITIE